MIDTVDALNNLNWSELKTWFASGWNSYPSIAGRYFGGGMTWHGTEFTEAYSDTGGTLKWIVPIRASEPADQETSGIAGYNLGYTAGNDTVHRINNAINAAQLLHGATSSVVVYLDVESGTALTADFWAGWADYIGTFSAGPEDIPFLPGIYCGYTSVGGGRYEMDTSIQAALNASQAAYPSAPTLCHGIWTSEPEPCTYCTDQSAMPSDLSQFNTFNQTYDGGTIAVPLYIWQYSERQPCMKYCHAPASIFGGQNVDLDTTDSSGCEAVALPIVT